MTIKELKEKYKDYVDIEVYVPTDGKEIFHTDYIKNVEEYPENLDVISWELMDKARYDASISANSSVSADEYWADWEDDDKVLCVLVPDTWYYVDFGYGYATEYTWGGDIPVTFTTIKEAQDYADEGISYTQMPVKIVDNNGDEVSRRAWCGVCNEDDTDDDYIYIGGGYYTAWTD